MTTDLKERLHELADDSRRPLPTNPEQLLRDARAARGRHRVLAIGGAGLLVAAVVAAAVTVPRLGADSAGKVGPAGGAGGQHAVAVRLQHRMGLSAAPEIGTAPEAGPRTGFVGLPTWMWLKSDPDAATPGLRTASVRSHGERVWVKARLDGVDWDMGDGKVEHCRTVGTPYQDSFGVKPSPDCGHKYKKVGTYEVTATPRWKVTWGVGEHDQRGTLPQQTSSASVRLRFSDLQVLNER